VHLTVVTSLLLRNPLVIEKCGITDHKPLTRGGLFLMADTSPVMSASIPGAPWYEVDRQVVLA